MERDVRKKHQFSQLQGNYRETVIGRKTLFECMRTEGGFLFTSSIWKQPSLWKEDTSLPSYIHPNTLPQKTSTTLTISHENLHPSFTTFVPSLCEKGHRYCILCIIEVLLELNLLREKGEEKKNGNCGT